MFSSLRGDTLQASGGKGRGRRAAAKLCTLDTIVEEIIHDLKTLSQPMYCITNHYLQLAMGTVLSEGEGGGRQLLYYVDKTLLKESTRDLKTWSQPMYYITHH